MIEKLNRIKECAGYRGGGTEFGDKINEIIDHLNSEKEHCTDDPLECPALKKFTDAEKGEYSEEEKNIIKWWREGMLTLHYNSTYRGAIVGAEKGERCPDRAIELLRLILPMARGYAAKNNVGNNQAFCDAAEQYLIVNEGKPSASGMGNNGYRYDQMRDCFVNQMGDTYVRK